MGDRVRAANRVWEEVECCGKSGEAYTSATSRLSDLNDSTVDASVHEGGCAGGLVMGVVNANVADQAGDDGRDGYVGLQKLSECGPGLL